MWLIRISMILYVNPLYAQYGTYIYSLLNRPTKQSSLYTEVTVGGEIIDGTSDKAVDEHTGNDFTQGSCSHTLDDNPAWWVVDMQNNVTVHSVIITNRGDCCDERLNKFSIFGVSSLHYSEEDGQECSRFDGSFGKGVTRTFNCFHHITTRFLAIAVYGQHRYLTLCNVQVSAECKDGEFGVNCAGKCSPHCKNSPCDKFSQYGICPDGECMDGYDGSNCTEVCPQSKYGPNCINDCSVNCKDQCSSMTGICKGGCNPGYTGDTCETECTPGNFGVNCELICSQNCKSSPCDRFDGSCPAGECEPGFTGMKCTEECPSGKYGYKCMSTCFPHCLSACDPVDGSCRSGCESGWTGRMCDVKTDEAEGPSTLALALPLAITSVLCIGLISYIIVTKVRQARAGLYGKNGPGTRPQEAAYVNDKQKNNHSIEQKTYEQIIATDNQNDSGQTYEELHM